MVPLKIVLNFLEPMTFPPKTGRFEFGVLLFKLAQERRASHEELVYYTPLGGDTKQVEIYQGVGHSKFLFPLFSLPITLQTFVIIFIPKYINNKVIPPSKMVLSFC